MAITPKTLDVWRIVCRRIETVIWTLTKTQLTPMKWYLNRRPDHKLEICTAPTKAKSRDPAYSQALIQNEIDRQRVRSRESGMQADCQTAMVDGVWSWEVGRRGWIRIGVVEVQCFQFGVNELRRDTCSKRWGLGEFVQWLRYLSQCWREFVPK